MEHAILETLAADGPLHVIELAERVDDHPLTVERACAHLHNNGHISQFGGGRYRLTDTGREQLMDAPLRNVENANID